VRSVLLFDMDGVLWDSSNAHAESFETVIRQNNLQIPKFDYSKYSGMSTERAWEKILEENSILETEKSQIKKLTFQKREAFANHRNNISLNTNLLNAASKVNSNDWGIVTSGSKESLTSFLTRSTFASRFQTVITSDDVKTSKPSPEGYTAAALRLNVSPESCVVFEDSIAGIQAATAAGMSVIHVLEVRKTTCTIHSPSARPSYFLGCVNYSGRGLKNLVGSKSL
jgi:beta-phosphoglucomutase